MNAILMEREVTMLLNEVERICEKLAKKDVETLFLSFGWTKETSRYTGSSVGQNFLQHLKILDKFQTFCRKAYAVKNKYKNVVHNESRSKSLKQTEENNGHDEDDSDIDDNTQQTYESSENVPSPINENREEEGCNVSSSDGNSTEQNQKNVFGKSQQKKNEEASNVEIKYPITPRITRSKSKLQEESPKSLKARQSQSLNKIPVQITRSHQDKPKEKTVKMKEEIKKKLDKKEKSKLKRSKNKMKQTGNDGTNQTGNDVTKQTGNDVTKQTGNDVKKKIGNDVKKKIGNEGTNQTGNDGTNQTGNDVTKQRGNDVTKQRGNDVTKQTGNDVIRDKVLLNQDETESDEEGKRKVHTCKVCNVMYYTSTSLLRHIKDTAHIQEGTCRCEVCDEYFLNMRSLGQHRTNMKHFLKCETCGKKFNRIKAFGIHQRLHKKEKRDIEKKLATERIEKKFSCDICSESFTTTRGLGQHRFRYKHYHKCSECGKMFTWKKIFDIHCRKHENRPRRWRKKKTQQSQYQCNFCGKIFGRSYPLSVHIRYHTGDKPYMCDKCGKVTASKTELNMHKLIHSDERPFSCDICNKTFKMLNKLKRHQIVHTGLKPYKCPECDKFFTTTSNMRIHMKNIHMGIKEFSCEVCDAKFAHSSNMRSHMKNVHKKKKQADDDDFDNEIEADDIVTNGNSVITVFPIDKTDCQETPFGKTESISQKNPNFGIMHEIKKERNIFDQFNSNSEIVIQFVPEVVSEMTKVGDSTSEITQVPKSDHNIYKDINVTKDLHMSDEARNNISEIQGHVILAEVANDTSYDLGQVSKYSSGLSQVKNSDDQTAGDNRTGIYVQHAFDSNCELVEENVEIEAHKKTASCELLQGSIEMHGQGETISGESVQVNMVPVLGETIGDELVQDSEDMNAPREIISAPREIISGELIEESQEKHVQEEMIIDEFVQDSGEMHTQGEITSAELIHQEVDEEAVGVQMHTQGEIISGIQQEDGTIIELNQDSEIHVVYQSENNEFIGELTEVKNDVPHLIYLYSTE